MPLASNLESESALGIDEQVDPLNPSVLQQQAGPGDPPAKKPVGYKAPAPLPDNPQTHQSMVTDMQRLQREGAPAAETEKPAHPIWEALKKGNRDAKAFNDELGKDVVKGALAVPRDVGRTVAEASAWFLHATKLGKLLGGDEWMKTYEQLGAKSFGDVAASPFDGLIDSDYLGGRSKSSGHAFVQDATQFVVAALSGESLLAGMSKIPTVIKGSSAVATGLEKYTFSSALKQIGSSAAKGAMVDFVAIDPYQDNLAELVGWDAMSVHAEDGPIEARIKRAFAGMLPGIALDGILHSAKALRARNVLKAGATGAEKEAAIKTLETSSTVLENIENGTHVPNEPIITVQTDAGTVPEVNKSYDNTRTAERSSGVVHVEQSLGIVPNNGLSSVESFGPGADGLTAREFVEQIDRRIADRRAGGEMPAGQVERRAGNADARGASAADAVVNAGGDELPIVSARRPSTDRRIGSDRAPEPGPQPAFEKRGDAEDLVSSVNAAIHARETGSLSGLTKEESESLVSFADQLKAAEGDHGAILDLLRSADRPRFTYADGAPRAKMLWHEIMTALGPIPEHLNAEGQISWSATAERAREALGMIPRSELKGLLEQAAAHGANADVAARVFDMQLMDIHADVNKFVEMFDASPNDMVARSQVDEAALSYIRTLTQATETNSGHARALNLLQAGEDVRLHPEDVKFAPEGTPSPDQAAGAPKGGSADPKPAQSHPESQAADEAKGAAADAKTALDEVRKEKKAKGEAKPKKEGEPKEPDNTQQSPASAGKVNLEDLIDARRFRRIEAAHEKIIQAGKIVEHNVEAALKKTQQRLREAFDFHTSGKTMPSAEALVAAGKAAPKDVLEEMSKLLESELAHVTKEAKIAKGTQAGEASVVKGTSERTPVDLLKLSEPVQEAIKELKQFNYTGVSASDIRDAKLWSKLDAAQKALKDARKVVQATAEENLAKSREILDRAKKLQQSGEAAPQGPLRGDVPPTNALDDITSLLQENESWLDRQVERAQKAREATPSQQPRAAERTPVDLHKLENPRTKEEIKAAQEKGQAKAAARQIEENFMKLSPEDRLEVARLFKFTDNPAALFDTMKAKIRQVGVGKNGEKLGKGAILVKGGLEYLMNSILSRMSTWGGIFASTGLTAGYEDAVRLLAGGKVALRTGNTELFRSGVDIITGRLLYLNQSFKYASQALKEGHSIIDPVAVSHDIGGLTGEVVRSMGSRPIAGVDEFWRSNSAFAYARMTFLKDARRMATSKGLTGSTFDEFVDSRVAALTKANIDAETGAMRLPEARKFATFATMSSPLGEDAFSRTIQEAVAKHDVLRPIMPFVRTSANILNYSFVKNTPLQLLTDQWKAAAKSGGDEAALQATRMGVGTAVWGMAGALAYFGQITGNGPQNPKLRSAWLKDHQPYSIKVGDTWISYRRLEPFATPLSFAADMGQITRDNGVNDPDNPEAQGVGYGVMAAMISSMTNKSYLSGMVNFMNAIGSRNTGGLKAFVDQQEKSLVPGFVDLFNNDPYLRQTSGMFDAFISRVPGWSKTLPARYDAYGTPISLDPSRQERTVNPFPMQKNSDGSSIEAGLLDLGQSLQAPATIERYGNYSIDLHDRNFKNTDGSDTTPYERWMEILQENDTRGKVAERLTELEASGASDTGNAFGPGEKFERLKAFTDREQQAAKRQMLSEYPELAQAMKAAARGERITKRSAAAGSRLLEELRQ